MRTWLLGLALASVGTAAMAADQVTPPAAPAASRPYELAVAAAELRPVDCNLAALCDHVQAEGFGSGAFSDVVVEAMGATYRLHRLIISRSTYFRSDHSSPTRMWIVRIGVAAPVDGACV
jgi:hypothetical protein